MLDLKLPKHAVLLIDGSNLLHRSYHSYPHQRTMTGQPIGALYGATKYLRSFYEELQAKKMIVALDANQKCFRHELYPEYKGNRPEKDPELVKQFSLLAEYCRLSDIQTVTKVGFEADDVIGSLSCQLLEEGYKPYVLTGDRDMFQLVNEEVNVLYLSPKDGLVLYDLNKIKERYLGLHPKQLIDVKALQGDASDNIKGITKIGEKTAIQLVSQYGHLDGIYENIKDLKGKQKEALINEKELAYLFRTLVTIKCDVEVEVNKDMECSFDNLQLREFQKQYYLPIYTNA